jgi:hypothetical protein
MVIWVGIFVSSIVLFLKWLQKKPIDKNGQGNDGNGDRGIFQKISSSPILAFHVSHVIILKSQV